MPKKTFRLGAGILALWFGLAAGASPWAVAQSNGVLREVYGNISGTSISALTNQTAFPANPTLETIQPQFEAPAEYGDNYGQRMRALLVPPMDGNYTFWMAADDNGELYVSTDDTPANKILIARVNSWTASREWTKEISQQSAAIPLLAGRKYYVEALQKEGGGSDNLAVRWRLPSGAMEEPIPGHRLLVYGLGPPEITRQPVNAVVVENGAASFRVQLGRTLGAAYQWQRDGTNLPGATSSVFTLAPVVLGDSGNRFRCVATNRFGGTNSLEAVLTVVPDTTLPALVSVAGLGDDETVTVTFSEPVDTASATRTENYALDQEARVLLVELGDDLRSVILTTTPLVSGPTYVLTVNGVYDRAATPNTIPPDTRRSFSLVYSPLEVNRIAGDYEPLSACSRRTGLVISELMYHPPNRPDGLNLEFIELYNSQEWAEDLSGYRLAGEIQYTFPTNTVLAARSFLVVAAAPEALRAVYQVQTLLGPYTNALSNASGTIVLLNRFGAVLLEARYGSWPPYPAAADGAGHSLALKRPSFGERHPRAWAASNRLGGSPGANDPVAADAVRTVMINELLARTDDPELDFIELFNYGSMPVPVGGCVLTDDPAVHKFVIPNNTVIAPRGFLAFDQRQLGFALNSGGETVYLVNTNSARVIDAVRFAGQAKGVSLGRFPDGAPAFSELCRPTFGANNSRRLQREVVINEIMYHPISGDSELEYVEIYNRGASTVNLDRWRLADGISFTFPANTLLPAGGYLVVARHAARLLTNYPHLSPSQVLGNFSGSLANSGERVILTMPDDVITTNAHGVAFTNVIRVVVDEVAYGTGGRWGRWADGGGSSLELVDPRADHRLAPNWMDSDETARSGWTTIEHTGRLDLGQGPADALQIFLLGAGECLVDDVEVIPAGGANLVANATFAGGMIGWTAQGNQNQSRVVDGGVNGGRCLRLRATGRGDTGANRVWTPLTTALREGNMVTLRAKARWLKGHPELLLRLRGNWLEATGNILTTTGFGTPGAPNSCGRENTGPAIVDVLHSPILPGANQTVTVSARVDDPDGLSSLRLFYRVDPATNYVVATMAYNGAGYYSAAIPGQAAEKLVAFYLEARDKYAPPASARFPGDAPRRECLVRFGEPATPARFGAYRFWLTQATLDQWAAREKLSNDPLDATFVNGNSRVVYNIGAQYSGSPWHAPGYSSPVGNPCDYVLWFPEDDLFLNDTDINLLLPGNGCCDGTLQRESLAYWLAGQLGLPATHRRHVAVFVNGNRRSTLMEDAQQPNRDFVTQWYPEDPDGDLHKIQLWFEFEADASSFTAVGASLGNYLTSGGRKKLARYRWNWASRAHGNSANDYTNLFALMDAATTGATGETYTRTIAGAVDIDQWMRTFAVEHMVGNVDSYGYSGGQNMYAYKPERDTWKLLIWDIDFAFAYGSPTDDLFGFGDSQVRRMADHPPFRRRYLRALEEAVNGPLLGARINAVLDARYHALAAAGLNPESPAAVKSYLSARRDFIQQELAKIPATFCVNGAADFTTNRNLVALAGTAPIAVDRLLVNGVAYQPVWSSITNWSLRLALAAGENVFQIQGIDTGGAIIHSHLTPLRIQNTGPEELPEEHLVINELMYHPRLADAEYLELYNTSEANAFDLSGYRLEELGFTFEQGTIIEPGGYAVVAKDAEVFAAAYGSLIPVAGEFGGKFDRQGETIRLLRPGPSLGQFILVDEVTYGCSAPWPESAAGFGASLQLIDPLQDNRRPANWAAVPTTITHAPQTLGAMTQGRLNSTANETAKWYTPGRENSVRSTLPNFPPVWLNELQPNNLDAVPGPADQSGEREPWVELFNSGVNWISLEGWHLAASYTNLGQWAFPPGVGIGPGGFLVVWLDGEPQETSFEELHANFRLPSLAGTLVLSQSNRILDYLEYNVPTAGRSYGSYPEGSMRGRRVLDYPTPGTPNRPEYVPLKVFINEWMAGNVGLVPDPADGNPPDYEDWFELYNAASEPADLGGYYLTDSLTNKTKWRVPTGTVIPAGGFRLVWADEETEQNGVNTDLHANFRLNFQGETLGLFAPDGALVDAVAFGAQTNNASEGRFPDGTGGIRFLGRPTPRAPNELGDTNTPPVLAMLPDRRVAEGSLLALDCAASDSDQPPQTLMFSLDPGAPSGMAIDANSGRLTWQPLEAEGPGVYTVTVRVTDQPGGSQAGLSATQTFTVTVSEVNNPPVLLPIVNRTIQAGGLLVISNTASDPDPDLQRLTFTLEGVPPEGMEINPANGVLTWVPSNSVEPGNYFITVRVADDGDPPLSDRKTAAIYVYREAIFRILSVAEVDTGEMLINWVGNLGDFYQVEFKNDLADPDWTPLGEPVVCPAATGGRRDRLEGARQRFYRVRKVE